MRGNLEENNMEKNLIGFIHFDKPNIKSNRVEGLVIKENSSKLLRNKFIKIVNALKDGKEFIGRILEGPFFQPEDVSRDSALAQVSILRGEEFPIPPNFYASIVIEIIGELDNNEEIRSTSSRPVPQSRILELDDKTINSILGLDKGNLIFGKLEGYSKVDVKFDSKKISIIPRNIGIFGTVGSGKTNTSQVLIEELAERESDDKWAVIVLDVEGEYTKMNEAKEQTSSYELGLLKNKYNMFPRGIKDFHVLKLSKHDSAIQSAEEITINVDQIDEYVLAEILQTTEPQTNALFAIIDYLNTNKRKKQPSNDPFLSSSKNGYTLNDIISKIDEQLRFKKDTKDKETTQDESLTTKSSLRPLKRKLSALKRTNAFDDESASSINPDLFLKPGRVTVIDLSYTGDNEKNLLTAQLLSRIFRAKKEDGRTGKATYPKTMIVIEEAHTFISKERKDKMKETIAMLKEIARRGRKRWLGLCFISQQPAHLPPEIFELANTRIIHNIRSTNNLDVLKYSSGDVTEEMWDSVPSLGVGQALVNGPQFKNSLVVEVRPCRTMRIRNEDQ